MALLLKDPGKGHGRHKGTLQVQVQHLGIILEFQIKHILVRTYGSAGHVAAGEAVPDAAVREVDEEIGVLITPDELQKAGVFKSELRPKAYWFDNEFHHTFLCILKVPLSQLNKQYSEVAALKLISVPDLETEVIKFHGTHSFVPHKEAYYSEVLKILKEVTGG